MSDELVSFCIRKGMSRFCPFFLAKKFGTIDNFLLEHNMDQFILDASIDPMEKAAFVEKINEFVDMRDEGLKQPAGGAQTQIVSYPNISTNGKPASKPRAYKKCKEDKKMATKMCFEEYSTTPSERYIYEVCRTKQFDCIINGCFFISKYRLPHNWSSTAIVRFLHNGSGVKNCKEFCEVIKAVASDMFPHLSEMFIYEIPRAALSGVCGIFAQRYPHLDDKWIFLKEQDEETDDKYVKAYKQFIDVSDILKEKMKNKFRNRSYRLKAQNMWPYQKMNVRAANLGKKRTLGMKKVRGRTSPVPQEQVQEAQLEYSIQEETEAAVNLQYLHHQMIHHQ